MCRKNPFEIGYWWPFMRRQIHWVWLCINVNFRPHAHKWGTHTAHSIAKESPSPSSSSSPSSSLSSQMRDWRGTVQIPCSMNRRLKTGQDCQKNQNLDLNKAVFPEDFLYEIDHQLWSEQPNNKCKFNWLLWMYIRMHCINNIHCIFLYLIVSAQFLLCSNQKVPIYYVQ